MRFFTKPLIFILFCINISIAQTIPSGMKYQAVARDAAGVVIANRPISLKIELKNSSTDGGQIYYVEEHKVTTNQIGLFDLVVGGGQRISGTFENIPWSSKDIWMGVSIKDANNANFSSVSESKLLAVPYAYYAVTAGDINGKVQNSSLRSEAELAPSCLCDGGIAQLKVLYTGPSAVSINVYKDKYLKELISTFNNVNTGAILTINAASIPDDKLKNETYFKVGSQGIGVVEVPTKCDDPIIGANFGNFSILSRTDKKNDIECSVCDMRVDWKVGGNGLLDLCNKLGTKSYTDLILITNNIERLRITKDGDISIENNFKVAKDVEIGNDLTVKRNVFLNTTGGSTSNYGPFTVASMSPTYLSGILTVDKSTLLNSSLMVNNMAPTNLTGTLTVDKATVLNSSLTVLGTFSLDNSFTVSGAANFSSTLNVIGATTLRKTLDVDAATNLNSTLKINNMAATTLTGTLDVDKAANFNSTLNVVGASTLKNTLTVDGVSTLKNNLNVDGATDLNTTLNVDGASTLKNTLTVDGVSTLKNNLNVDGATDLNTTLNVDGASTLKNTLMVNGVSTLKSNLNVDGATDLNSTFNVDGTSTLNGLTVVNNIFTVTKNVAEGSFLATFTNLNGQDGDGINIKLGKEKSSYLVPALPTLLSQAQVDDIKNLIRCDFPGNKIELLGNIIISTAIDDLTAIAGLAIGTGNLIIGFINSNLGLPIYLGPVTTPSIDFPALSVPGIVVDVPVIPTFTLPGFTITGGFNILPPTEILPRFQVVPAIPTINLSSLGIPEIPVTDLNF